MAISVVGQASAAATSVAIPAHAVGDLIIVSARGTVAPSVPAAAGTVPAWQTLQSAAQFSIALTVASFVATATNTTTGTWTNATHVAVLVLRPGAGNTISTSAARSSVGGANNATTIIYPALTLVKTDGTSMGVRVGTRVTASTQLATNGPTSWTEQTEQPATTAALVVYTRAALAANPVADTVTAGASNAAYRAVTIEVQENVPVTYFGVVARGITLGQSVVGTRTTFSSLALPVTFIKAVAGNIYVAGPQTYFGVVTAPWTFGAVTQGQRKTFGTVFMPITWTTVDIGHPTAGVAGTRKTFGVVARPITFTKAVQGVRKTFGVVALPITFTKAVQGIALAAPKYGAVAASFTFGAVTQGRRTAFGVVARPITFAAVTQAKLKRFGVVALQVTATFVTQARASVRGVVARPIFFGASTKGGVFRLLPSQPDTFSLLSPVASDSLTPPVGAPPDPLTSFWEVLRASDQTYCGRYRCGQQWLVNVSLQPQWPGVDGPVLVGSPADAALFTAQTVDDLG